MSSSKGLRSSAFPRYPTIRPFLGRELDQEAPRPGGRQVCGLRFGRWWLAEGDGDEAAGGDAAEGVFACFAGAEEEDESVAAAELQPL